MQVGSLARCVGGNDHFSGDSCNPRRIVRRTSTVAWAVPNAVVAAVGKFSGGSFESLRPC